MFLRAWAIFIFIIQFPKGEKAMKTKLKNSNKIISIVLALVMIIGMLPTHTVLATDAVELPTKLYVEYRQ